MDKTIEERVAELEERIEECATHADLKALRTEILSESAAIVAKGTKDLVKGFFGHIIKVPIVAAQFVKSKLARKPAKAQAPVAEPQAV